MSKTQFLPKPHIRRFAGKPAISCGHDAYPDQPRGCRMIRDISSGGLPCIPPTLPTPYLATGWAVPVGPGLRSSFDWVHFELNKATVDVHTISLWVTGIYPVCGGRSSFYGFLTGFLGCSSKRPGSLVGHLPPPPPLLVVCCFCVCDESGHFLRRAPWSGAWALASLVV